MKKWKKCPLLIVTAISMLLVSGVALAGTKGAYKEYNKDWPKVPAVAGMMQETMEDTLFRLLKQLQTCLTLTARILKHSVIVLVFLRAETVFRMFWMK